MTAPIRPLALSCALLLALAACKSEAPPQAPPPPDVGVVTVAPQTVPLQRDMVGRLSPFRSSDVRARVPGVLLKRVYQRSKCDAAAGAMPPADCIVAAPSAAR